MRLTFEDIALRDMQESDIEDYVRWFTTETKWNDYDAPWEPIEDIDICESDVWGHGVGTKVLRTFMNYYFDQGCHELYTQTWSGNFRMIRCAQKLGFQECEREIGNREVNGKKYDGLTSLVKSQDVLDGL